MTRNETKALAASLIISAITCISCAFVPQPAEDPQEPSITVELPETEQDPEKPVRGTWEEVKEAAEPASFPEDLRVKVEQLAGQIPEGAAELIGRTIWGEADGVKDPAERAAVAWCILNRVDAWDQSIEEVVTAPRQFHGYRDWGECPQRHIDMAADVLLRWAAEKAGAKDVGRVLPAEYLYFIGDGDRNHFTTEFLEVKFWDWSMANPYT